MATLTVRKNGTGQYTQINDAILDAVFGDVIDIGPGTYLENVDLYKGVTLQGAGKDQTFIQGKLTGDTFTGTRTLGSKFITGISALDLEKLIAGRTISGTGITAGTRINNIDLESAEIELTLPATSSGTTALTQVAIPQGSILAKQQTESMSVSYVADSDAAFSLYTLSRAPIYGLRVGDKLIVGANERTIVEITSSTTGKLSGTPLATGTSTLAYQAGYWTVKDLCVLGYDGATPSDAGAFFISSPSAGGFKQTNWLIDNCRIVAAGDHGLVTSGNLSSDGGTVQNCLFEGKTYINDEPADVPAFSTFTKTGTLVSATSTSYGVQFDSSNGFVVGTILTAPALRASPFQTTVTAISGNIVTVNVLTESIAGGTALSATRTSGSATVSVAPASAAALAALRVGVGLTGTGIPANTRVLAIDLVASTIQLSQNATASGTSNLTPVNGLALRGDGKYDFVLTKDTKAQLIAGDKLSFTGFTLTVVSSGDLRSGVASLDAPATVNQGTATVRYCGNSLGIDFGVTVGNVQFTVPNVARQMVVIGNSGSVSNCLNTTFKNNVVKGRTGAVIAASGSNNMFNAAVTVDTVGGLIEGNIIDGNFGAGPNTLASNFAIRSRGAGVVVKDNVNKVFGGRGNSGFFAPLAAQDLNNVTIDVGLVTPTQAPGADPVALMSKAFLKSLPAVDLSPVFSDESNWALVAFVYKHTGSNKRIVAAFKSFEEGKEARMRRKSGMEAGQSFELIKVIILDQSRNPLVIRRLSIEDASSYDFSLL